jgi:hypothetical protein
MVCAVAFHQLTIFSTYHFVNQLVHKCFEAKIG